VPDAPAAPRVIAPVTAHSLRLQWHRPYSHLEPVLCYRVERTVVALPTVHISAAASAMVDEEDDDKDGASGLSARDGDDPAATAALSHPTKHSITACSSGKKQKSTATAPSSAAPPVITEFATNDGLGSPRPCTAHGHDSLGQQQHQLLIQHTIADLAPCTAYAFRVCAVTAAGAGPFSPPSLAVVTQVRSRVNVLRCKRSSDHS
jgi:hypothetical protein